MVSNATTIDEVPHARVLDGDQPVVGEQVRHAGNEVVRVRNVGHHVVGDDHVGGPTLGAQPLCCAQAEELLERLDPDVAGRLGLPRSGIESDGGDAFVDEVLEQVAVVARNFDDQ